MMNVLIAAAALSRLQGWNVSGMVGRETLCSWLSLATIGPVLEAFFR